MQSLQQLVTRGTGDRLHITLTPGHPTRVSLQPDKSRHRQSRRHRGSTRRKEVGCWSHVRRKFWEGSKQALGREGLFRFEGSSSSTLAGKTSRPTRAELCGKPSCGPAEREYEACKMERGVVATALGYAVRPCAALRHVLEDGRLKLDNSRRATRPKRIWKPMSKRQLSKDLAHLRNFPENHLANHTS